TLVLYPGSLFYLLLPLSWSLAVFCLLHQFLAGMGMFCLASRWTGNRLAASVAGVAFAFNGLTLNCLMWPNNIAALGWMPWVVLLVEQALPGGAQRVLSAIAVGALQMLAGAPEIILFTWLVAGLLFAAEWTRQPEKRMSMTVHFGLTILAVASLCAVQLLPFLDLLGHSQRDTRFA